MNELKTPAEANNLKRTRYKTDFVTGKLYCLHPDQSSVFAYDRATGCISLIDLYTEAKISECVIELFQPTTKWVAFQAIESKPNSTFLLTMSLLEDQISYKYYMESFEIIFDSNIMMVKPISWTEQNLNGKGIQEELFEEEPYGSICQDENGRLYCIIWRCSKEPSCFTWFTIEAVSTDRNGKICIDKIANEKGIAVKGNWKLPFIQNNSILFHSSGVENITELFKASFSSLLELETIQHPIIVGKFGNLPYSGMVSMWTLCGQILYYTIDKRSQTGEFGGLSLQLMRWKSYFKFSEHAVMNGTLIVTNDCRVFVLGGCVKQDCKKQIHNYQPSFGISAEKIFLNFYQLSPFYSQEKFQIISGGSLYEQSKLMLMKAKESQNPKESNYFIFVLDENDINRYGPECFKFEGFYDLFDSNKIFITKNSFTCYKGINEDSTLFYFIDSPQSLSVEQKTWHQNRRGKSYIALSSEIKPGLDHPRINIAWHNLQLAPYSNQSTNNSPETSTHLQSTTGSANEFKRFVALSMEAMDQFYPDWFADSCAKATVCIPACLDLKNNRYRGPNHPSAAGFNDTLFDKKKSHFVGQRAEDAFLLCFQNINIGGVLIHGFDTNEYANLQRMVAKFKKWKIGKVEIDFLFIHPSFGVFVIEVKGCEMDVLSREAPVFKKALKQLQATKMLIPVLFENLTGTVFEFPIHCVACFPSATVQKSVSNDDANIRFIDASVINDIEEVRRLLLENIDLAEYSSESLLTLKKFTCSIAGYRSVDDWSIGYNALSVHDLVANQSFQDVTRPLSNDGVFLTQEQLTVMDSNHERLIISGPPGTGKTLIVLSKAMRAATTEKNGSVRVITANKVLAEKFQKYFTQKTKSSKILRFPIVSSDWFAEPEDDVYIDEAFFLKDPISFLQQRLRASGATICALTGWLKPFQIVATEQNLIEHGLADYDHVSMKTVVRNTNAIFNKWKAEYPKEFQFNIGHSICGQRVEYHFAKNVQVALETLIEALQQFFVCRTASTGNQGANIQRDGLLPGHICIISNHKDSCDKIKNFLASKGIASGSIYEQLFNPDLVAVARFEETLSFEWPVVILISLLISDMWKPFELISSSRCIARLIIIKRDYMAIQTAIDQKLKSSLLNLNEMQLHQLFITIVGVHKDVGEQDTDALPTDVSLAFIRLNYLPLELQSIKEFEGCRTMFECLSKITNNDAICQALLDCPQIRNLYSDVVQQQQWLRTMGEGLADLLFQLWSTLTEQEKKSRWETVQNFIRKLTTVHRSIMAIGYIPGDERSKTAFVTAVQQNMAWSFYTDIIQFLTINCEIEYITDK